MRHIKMVHVRDHRRRRKALLRKVLYYILALAYVCGSSAIVTPSAFAADCPSVQFVFARGSGEVIGGPSYEAWRTSIMRRMNKLTVSYGFYELGSRSYGGHQYPATAVSGSVAGVVNLIGAAISGGALFGFGKRVDEGVAELKAYISTMESRCSDTRFVLGGYSQGAMLISRTLGELDASKIIYVSTFGDPKLYLPEGKKHAFQKPDACYGRNLSNYRINVSDCYAYEGVLGSYKPYQPEYYIDKLGTWCNKNDIMCSSRVNTGDHTAYVAENLYDEAAAIITSKISQYFGSYETSSPNAMHEVAFLVDNTASMRYKKSSYRKAIGDFAERIIASGGRIALYEFGELAEGTKTIGRCGFDCSAAGFKSGYDDIYLRGGGDDPESVLSGLKTTMDTLDWTNGATKSIVVLNDSAYHDPDVDGVTLDDVVKRSLEIDPVNIYVIDPGDFADDYQELVTRTNGGFINEGSDADDMWSELFTRPIARLKLMDYKAEVDSTLEFDATDSYAEDGGNLRFDWDLDGDGIFEKEDTEAVVSHSYTQPFDGYIQVKVRDQNDNIATMSAHVNINTEEPVYELAKITNFSSWEHGVSTVINFTTTGTKVLLATNETPLGFVNLSEGIGEVKIDNLKEATNLYLIPYSEDGIRGLRYDFELPPTSVPDKADETDDANEIDKVDGASEWDVRAEDTKTTNGLPYRLLPKVPNAGVYTNDR